MASSITNLSYGTYIFYAWIPKAGDEVHNRQINIKLDRDGAGPGKSGYQALVEAALCWNKEENTLGFLHGENILAVYPKRIGVSGATYEEARLKAFEIARDGFLQQGYDTIDNKWYNPAELQAMSEENNMKKTRFTDL